MVISRCKRDHALCTISVLRDYVRIATVISRNKKINLYDTNNSKFFFFLFIFPLVYRSSVARNNPLLFPKKYKNCATDNW